jgi:hypothetical protein
VRQARKTHESAIHERNPEDIMKRYRAFAASICAAAVLFGAAPRAAQAHCDTLDGPVVVDARAALDAGDIGPVMKWVRAEDEAAIRAAFARTVEVRKGSEAARELADTWFFETLVRIHRAGEGAPYTGLKAGGAVEPGIASADRALVDGDADALVAALSAELETGVRERFERAAARREHAGHDVEAGRAYVAAYVDFIHYVEGLHQVLASSHHGTGPAAPAAHQH